MASLLYRLGLFSARKPWAVVIAWLLLLGTVTGAAATLRKPLSSAITVEGLQFADTLDTLKKEIPDAAGGVATVVFTTDDGRFTPAQQQAVAKVVTEWEGQPAVASALDPFATQKSIDDGQAKVVEGEKALADNERTLTDGAARLEAGKKAIADNTAKLQDGRSELTVALRQLADGEAKLSAGKARVAAGKRELAAGRKKLSAGKAELAAGKRKVATGKAQLAEGKRKIAAAQARIDDGKRQLAAGQAKIDDGKRQLAAGQAKIDDGKRQLGGARAKVEAGESQLAAARTKVETGERQLTTARAQVAQAETARSGLQARLQDPALTPEEKAATEAQVATLTQQIDAGKATIAEQEPRLAAARRQIAAQEPEVKAGRKTLDAKAGELAAAQRTLDGKRAELAAAQRTLDGKRAELRRGQATLDAQAEKVEGSEAQLAAAQRKVAAGQREIDAAEAKLARGQRAMAAADAQIRANEARLAAGRRKAEAGQIRISEGEAQLIAARDRLKASEQQIQGGRAKLEQGKAQLALGKREAALTQGLRFVSEDGTAAMSQVRFHEELNLVAPEDRKAVTTVTDELQQAGVTVDYGKELTDDVSSVMGPGEVVGVVIAGVVLLVMLGTLVAAGLPLLMALGGVGLAIGVVMALTHWVELNSITPALGLMIGLAVGIDYALFIVNRHREQLKTGMARRESIALAVGTAGNAVTFAGMTVFIALAALAVTGMGFLAAMGFAAAGTVACAVLINLTLLPALMSLAGHRMLPRRAWRKAGFSDTGEPLERDRPADEEHLDRGWGAAVTRRPWLAIVGSLVVVAILGFPAAGLRLGLPDGGSEPADSTAYRAYSIIGDKFGAGANGPIVAVAALPETADADAAKAKQLDVAEELATVEGLTRVAPAGLSKDRRTAVYQAIPDGGPADEATVRTVERLRDDAPAIKERTGADVQVTGQTVANIDISQKLADAMPLYLTIVVGLSLILLLMVFRSVVVPFIATGGFLLSLVAAFGGVVAVYQRGHLGSLFGVTNPSAVLSFLPILLIGVLFGLAMDYQMFLVSGMREAYVHGRDPRTAVRSGFSHAAPVVTAAAIIMVSVFAGFVFAHLTMIRPIGFGLALGVLVDAFLVRMTLTPAVMHLLGDKAWYLPRWLDRLIPDVDVEGVKLVDKVAHARPSAVGATAVSAGYDDHDAHRSTEAQPDPTDGPAAR